MAEQQLEPQDKQGSPSWEYHQFIRTMRDDLERIQSGGGQISTYLTAPVAFAAPRAVAQEVHFVPAAPPLDRQTETFGEKGAFEPPHPQPPESGELDLLAVLAGGA